MHLTRRTGREELRQIQRHTMLDGQQRWQAMRLRRLARRRQAFFQFLVAVGRMAEALQHFTQDTVRNGLRLAVGIGPVDSDTRLLGEVMQLLLLAHAAVSAALAGIRLISAVRAGKP